MNIKKHIPNAITCCNLLCGCLAIVQAFEGNLVYSAYLVGLAAIFDFFDGFAARLLRVASPIGKDLDSLADMVTFGVVPGFVMFKLIFMGLLVYGIDGLSSEGWTIYPPLSVNGATNERMILPEYVIYSAFLIPVFSAIRLAKFNNDNRQSDSFIGVPTPANAIFICSIPLIFEHNDISFVLNPYVLIIATIIFSLLLISEIPLFALKFRNFSWRGNRIRYTFLGLSLLLLITLQYVGIPLIIILYILMSLVTNFYLKRRVV
ncbi:MAG: CDP-diacylglycerol--serine O-phosphatidyltransferase [Sphingobacteriaceae bacterium]|nr:CDP-diacylglycerol--serine O-phosphatidyltransferase [Sphingobacteriaceae bacterium]